MLARPSHGEKMTCTISVAGRRLEVPAGLSIAAVLTREGEPDFSVGNNGDARGLFCGMGACHDCLVTVDGRTGQRACMTMVRDGMVINPGASRPDITDPALADLAPVPRQIAQTEIEMAVVGGGPAGLAAAQHAAAAGIGVIVLDERHSAGGQYYKQPATQQVRFDAQSRAGRDAIETAERAGVDIQSSTTVWGAARDEDGVARLACIGPGGVYYLRAKQVVIATGAYERPAAVPNWDIPGTMTAGAAQTLLRAYGTLPGKRVLVTGNGPLNLQIAVEILRRGGEVAGLVEAASPPWTKPGLGLTLLRRDPALARLGMQHLATLTRSGAPVYWGSHLVKVLGTKKAYGAHIRTPGGGITIDADCVLMGGSFASDNVLSRLLGCTHDVESGHLVARREPDGQTSQADVHIIGEAGRFGGAQVAIAEGRLAAASAIAKLKGKDSDRNVLLRRRERALRFQQTLWKLFEPQSDKPTSPDATMLCRCEAVTRAELARAAQGAAPDAATLKRLTRAGMGRCQGRYCTHQLNAIAKPLATTSERSIALAPQMPVRPIPLAALALEKPEWGGHRRALLPGLTAVDADPLDVAASEIVVIGAGVVGISTALFLARAGAQVTILEHGYANNMASGGNAGSLHAQLLSFDHGSRAEGSGAVRTLPLQRDSIALWAKFQDEFKADFEMKITGGLMVAETEAHLCFLEEKTAAERAMGIEATIIGADELMRREPALNARFLGAAWCPLEGKINPLIATQTLLDEALRLGVRLKDRCSVQTIEAVSDGFVILSSRGKIRAKKVINAAGAFASHIGAMLGCPVPVFGAPLQMVVTEAAAPAITALIAHADRHLTLKQASNGNFIIGGGWTAGLDPVHGHPRPLTTSLEGNLWVAQHVVPGLRKLHVIRSWAAMNINIDGAPILGQDPRQPGFFHAVTSNGYTLGPIMGELTAALVTDQNPGRDLSPFLLSRFD